MVGNAIAYVSQLGWKSQLGLVTYSAPIILWGLGAVEGAVRTAFNGIASVFAPQQDSENSQKRWAQCKKDGGITLSCLAITTISLVPVVGTSMGLWEFNNQCRSYAKIKATLEANRQKDFLVVLSRGFNAFDRSNVTEQSLNQLWNQIEHDSKNYIPEEKLDLPASLIHTYYGYSITYITLEKTTESLQYTAGKVKKLILYLSQHNIVKSIGICAFNAIKNEVRQTLNDTVDNQRGQKVK